MERRFGAARRPDDEDALSRALLIAGTECRKQRRYQIAAGNERQCEPIEPRQSPHNAAVAQRQPRIAVEREQLAWLIVSANDVVGVRRDHVPIRRATLPDDDV